MVIIRIKQSNAIHGGRSLVLNSDLVIKVDRVGSLELERSMLSIVEGVGSLESFFQCIFVIVRSELTLVFSGGTSAS